MPLVSDLTNELKSWLTPDKLRELNVSWREQRSGYSDTVVDELTRCLVNRKMHYENILGYLEVQYKRPSQLIQEYDGLYWWLLEFVHWILYIRHVRNGVYIETGVRYLEGIVGLARANQPLWIFSLNHDLIIECLAAHYGVPLHSGFPNKTFLPRRNTQGSQTGQLQFDLLPGDRFKSSGLAFPETGTPGINLLKIHGALDVFATNDKQDFLKLVPSEPGVRGVIAALQATNTELLYSDPRLPGGAVKATNEITYADDQGVMQFLRRTHLAGAFKYDQGYSQVLPLAFLEHFRNYLNRVTTLICIGYSFGDAHINEGLRNWLEHTANRRLEIVGPGTKRAPSTLSHLAPQITLIDITATEYLERFALKPLRPDERFLRKVRRAMCKIHRWKKGVA